MNAGVVSPQTSS